MAEAILKKEVCQNCGMDVRPDTQFCYNCGKSVSLPEVDSNNEKTDVDLEEKDASLADLEMALAASRLAANDSKSKIEAAAAERRRARTGHRKPLEVVWDRANNDSSWVYLFTVGLIFVLVLLTVLVTVVWK